MAPLIHVDANLLIYAYNPDSEHHAAARTWLQETISGDEDVGIALMSVLAFIRITTGPSVLTRPIRIAQAIHIVKDWLAEPNVGIVGPTARHLSVLEDLLTGGQAQGPLVMDAHLAALAMEHGATLCSTDRDFARFPGLRFQNPIAT